MVPKISFSLVFIVLVSVLTAQDDLPGKPGSWVNDYAGVLSLAEKQDLDDMLSALEKRSSNQIFIAILDQMPENAYPEEFAVKLYDKWKPGLADQDNGILIVIFINDRKIRIEVGYGLEDAVTDAQSGTLIRDYMGPEFKQQNYYAGLRAALDVLIPAVEGKYKIPVASKHEEGNYFGLGTIIAMFVIFIFLSRLLGTLRTTGFGTKKRGSSFDGPFWWGGFGGGSSGSGGSGGGFSGGSFGGGFGGSSGGGGATGSW
jgi:uncharacterized protein